jgi:hypothetical protein
VIHKKTTLGEETEKENKAGIPFGKAGRTTTS